MKNMMGILLLIIIVLIVVMIVSKYLFNQKVNTEIYQMLSDVNHQPKTFITEDSVLEVPEVVQRWMRYSQVIGKEEITCVRLKQKGELRLKTDQSWLKAESQQYFTVTNPAFLWKVDVKMFPLVSISGRDSLHNGKGEMLIKLASLIPVVDAKGDEINQGTMIRFLSEIIWFPSAALNDYIEWEQIDDTTARARFKYNDHTVEGDFTIDLQGRVTQFTAKRFREDAGQYSLDTWVVKIGEYKDFNGYIIPSEGKVIWELDTGDFEWYRLTIEDIEYNNATLYR